MHAGHFTGMAASFMWPVTDEEKAARVMAVVRHATRVGDHVKHIPVENPVSIDRDNLGLLRGRDYTVSFKADGTRYLLVLCTHRARPIATSPCARPRNCCWRRA